MNHRLIGLVLLVLWLPNVAGLSLLPSEHLQAMQEIMASKPPAANEADADNQLGLTSSRIWVEWTVKWFFTLAGIFSGIAAFQGRRNWAGFAASIAGANFLSMIIVFSLYGSSFLDARSDDDRLSATPFFWIYLIQPIALLMMFLYLMYYRSGINRDPNA